MTDSSSSLVHPRHHNIEEAVTILNTVCLDRSLPKRPVLLCATNAVADGYNNAASHLKAAAALPAALKAKPKATDDRFPAPMELVLSAARA